MFVYYIGGVYLDTGILFNGLFLGSETRNKSDGKTDFRVAVACGMRSYVISMDNFYDFSKLSVGAPVVIKAEPNVYNGVLYWRHGVVCARS